MDKKLKIAGNVIGELSKKIPSNIIALNELIKNSYDAGAQNVSIILNTQNRKLIILDDGCGMNESEIEVLLQVSKSSKKYGVLNSKTGRYTQGSKGLGFLSVFRFGNKVKWITINDKMRSFSIDYYDISALDDISNYNIHIHEENSNSQKTGTKIEISLKNDSSLYLKKYLFDQINRDKILNSLLDTNFKISIIIDGSKYYSKDNYSLQSYYPKNQLFYVCFSSSDKKVHFYYRDHFKFGTLQNKNEKEKTIIYNSEIDKRISLNIELMIFDFSYTKRNCDPDKLFIRSKQLTPLIYINKNLFNNFSLFDPNLLRYSQNSISLPQMIGYIEIISNDRNIQFNSDRTQFQENDLTNSIVKTLKDLNRFIQKNGSEYKSEIKKISKECKLKVNNKKTTHTPTINNNSKKDKNSDYTKTTKPVILDVEKQIKLKAPTGQIYLKDYIKKAIDSSGNTIDKNKIQVKVDDKNINYGIIESIDENCEKQIYYIYDDPITHLVRSKLTLIVEQIPIKTNARKKSILIPNKGCPSYVINFKENPITDLIKQLEKLYSNYGNCYNEVIACSLRALFELSIYELEISNKVKFSGKSNDILTGKVVYLISNVINNNKLISDILFGLGRKDFHQFKNELVSTDFEAVIKKCHLGAHKSSYSFVNNDFEFVGNAAGLFIAIVNELINNNKINWDSLGKPWNIDLSSNN